MIDIENDVYNIVATEIRKAYPDAYITGEYVKSPSRFPCVSLVEMDNSAYIKTQTSSNGENHAEIMYELNIYSNKISGKKRECKAIASLVDNEMATLNFSRIMLQPIPNMDDATIYRMTGRYRAVVSKDKILYRR